jgi:O-antigen ligase
VRKAVVCLLCAVVFCIPWEEMAVLPGARTLIFDISVVAITLAAYAVLRRKLKMPPLALALLALFILRSYFSALWANDAEAALKGSVTLTSLLGLTWMIFEFGREEDRALWIMRAYLLGCCVALATMAAAFLQGRPPALSAEDARIQGGGLNANDIAAILALAVPMSVYLADARSTRKWAKPLHWLFVPAAVLGVFLTGSRAGMIALSGGMLLLAFPMAFRRPKTVFALALAVGASGVMIPRIVPENVLARLTEGTQAGTFQIRLRLWQAGLDYFMDHPLLGCGTWNFKDTVASRVAEQFVAHNTFISVLAEGGLLGFSLMAAFWFLLARMIMRLKSDERILWLTVGAVWTLCVMTLSWETNKSTWLLYGLLMARHGAAYPGSPKGGSAR